MAAKRSKERLKRKGGLKTVFLAAALFMGPSVVNAPSPVTGVDAFYQSSPAEYFDFDLRSRQDEAWLDCRTNFSLDKSDLNTGFQGELGTVSSIEAREILSYVQENELSFCAVDDRQKANKYDEKTKQISFYQQSDPRLNFLSMVNLAAERKYGAFTNTADFKKWDYKSQLLFSFAVKARARADMGIIVEHHARIATGYKDIVEAQEAEFSALYKVDKSVRALAIQNYVSNILNKPSVYNYLAPQMITTMFEQVASGQYQEIGSYTSNMIWSAAEAQEQLQEIGLSQSVLPDKFETREVLKEYQDQLAYLDAKRRVPEQKLYSLHNVYSQLELSDLTALYKVSDYQLNISQVFERTRNGFQGHPYEFFSVDNKNAIQADFLDYQINPDQRFLWHNIQRINRQQTIIGQLLYKHAVDNNVFFNEESVGDHSTGTWSSTNNMVSVRPHDHEGYSHHYAVGTVAHEILHSVQDKRGVLEYSNHWSIEEYQSQVMSYEAAAFVAARLVAFELQMQGFDPKPWDAVKGTSVAKKIEKTYSQHINGDKNHLEALERAGSAAWSEVFKNQSWLDTYNKWVIRLYIERLVDGRLGVERHADFSLNEARMDGYVSPLFNATAHIDKLPDPSDLFGDNSTMQQLYGFLELEFLGRTLGHNNSTYQNLKSKLTANDNPFLRSVVLEHLSLEGRSGHDVYNQILCAAVHNECKMPEPVQIEAAINQPQV